jgi:outer membrane lipopolysaccharide assembly protein LptE/RlpB
MRAKTIAMKAALTLAAALSLTGCAGWSHNGTGSAESSYQWTSLYRQDVHTVAVPIFTNVSYSRGDEFALTKAVVTQLEQRTPYKVVDQSHADTILEGQITKVNKQTISSDRNSALPQEQLYIMTVNFIWKDLRSGKILCERRGFEWQAPFYPTLGEGQETGQLNTAEQLALQIVQELQADW